MRWSFPLLGLAAFILPISAAEPLRPASERFRAAAGAEVPSFQKHILPLMGRLGCNGRACHGSFQGAGGFSLSLFGYDFEKDHAAMLKGKRPRVNLEDPADSRILTKPTDADAHKGGKRFDQGGWEYHLLLRWITAGAKLDPAEQPKFVRLELTPRELAFARPGDTIRMRVVSRWSDGSFEDVTPLSRFQSNNEAVATVDEGGVVTCVGPGDTHIVAFYDNGVEPVPALLPLTAKAGVNYPPVHTSTKVDELVVAKLRKLGVVPSERCTDSEFLRRVSFDLTGTLPTPHEIEAFLADPDPAKRAKKVDELLGRPAYAAWWATKFCDVWGNNEAYFAGVLRADVSRMWYEWVRDRVEKNTPYDEMVAGMVLGSSRRPGQSYEESCAEWSTYFNSENPAHINDRPTVPFYWARAPFRTADSKALAFGYAFLGIRLQCAECHKHPFDVWTQKDFQQFSSFFDRVVNRGHQLDPATVAAKARLIKEGGLTGLERNPLQFKMDDLVRAGKPVPFEETFVREPGSKGPPGRGLTPKPLGAAEVPEAAIGDPRVPLLVWMRSPENPYFARALVNRVWASYFHTGLVEPTDDQNRANPPIHEPVLDHLAAEFTRHGYDLKWLHRAITTTDTYQRSWLPNETNKGDTRNFSRAVPRRLPGEAIFDAISQATGTAAGARALRADPAGRAIAIQGSTDQRGVGNYALQMYGKPARDALCDCDRVNAPNLLQAIYLRNDDEVLTNIERTGGWLEQVARKNGVKYAFKKAYDAGKSPRIVNMLKQLPEFEERVARLKKEGAPPDKVFEAEHRLRSTKLYLAGAGVSRPPPLPTAEDTAAVPTTPDGLIREAYLRTLCRQPTDAEQDRARKHLAGADNLVAGLRDLLWALVNTREFLVNH